MTKPTALRFDISFRHFSKIQDLDVSEGSALIVGTPSFSSETKKADKDLKQSLKNIYALAHRTEGFEGRAGQLTYFPHHTQALTEYSGYEHLLLAGIGKPQDFYAQNILSWAGAIGRKLKDENIGFADIHLDSFFNAAHSVEAPDAPRDFAGRPHPGGIPNREEFLELFACGLQLGAYSFTAFKSDVKSDKTKKVPTKTLKIRLLSQSVEAKKASQILAHAKVISESVFLTRDLQTTPSNHLPPAELARRAQAAGKNSGFKVTVWDEKKLATEGMNGILAVGQGSANPPRLITMEYGTKKKGVPTIVFVGKGITFDAGGISIKPAAGMEDMKYDMSGSAAVIGAISACAQLKVPAHVVALVASAENMPSGTATRPGDVYTAYDGQTVEVINTDAEGRLVLADALAYAKNFAPTCVIDVATLTGAVMVALGYPSSGIMGNNYNLTQAFRAASEKVGEKCWELPLYEEYKDDMRSKCADYRNSGDRMGGAQKGATFMNFFVDGAYPWLHVDIAATDIPKGLGAHCPSDCGSGVTVRALVELTRHFDRYFKV
jgi:leucyl aminopeptidase